jgi:Holliday junction DNA helicase RuvA
MISYLKGKIIHIGLGWIILDIGNIGYKVYVVGNNKLRALPRGREIGNSVELFTYQHIREDKSDLYGFSDISQLEIFETLISVSGLGPKMAMSVLVSKGKTDIEKAIESGDYKTFQEIKGIGKKLAAKIILELKNKIEKADLDNLNERENKDPELEEALVSLGYKSKEAQKISSSIPENLTSLQQKVKWALKNHN